MGYDICATGEWEIDEADERVAINAMLLACAQKDGCSHITDWMIQEQPLVDPEDRDSCLEYLMEKLERGTIDYTPGSDGSEDGFVLRFHDGGYIRSPEDDQWLFEAVAPYADAEASAIYFEGEDGYKWMWEIDDKGKFVEHGGSTVYGVAAKAPEVVQTIVGLIYDSEGRPRDLQGSDAIGTLDAIENALREAGFGPQAGMTELDRLASAGG